MENIARYIAFRYKHDGLFSNIIENWKDHHGTVKTFKILNLPPLLDICKVEKYQPMKKIFEKFC